LVEHDLAKVGVAGSSPVFRSGSSRITGGFFVLLLSIDALVVKLVDTQDLKSCGQQWPYRFNSDPGHFCIGPDAAKPVWMQIQTRQSRSGCNLQSSA
jgi:hypothetical protein